MEFPTEIIGDKGFIKVTGDLDTEAAGEALRSAFNDIYDKGKRTIVLDLAGAQIINSYGIGSGRFPDFRNRNNIIRVPVIQVVDGYA